MIRHTSEHRAGRTAESPTRDSAVLLPGQDPVHAVTHPLAEFLPGGFTRCQGGAESSGCAGTSTRGRGRPLTWTGTMKRFLCGVAALAAFLAMPGLALAGADDVREPTVVVEVVIGADEDTAHGEVSAIAARVCGVNAEHPIPFTLGQECMVGDGSKGCDVIAYMFICVGERA